MSHPLQRALLFALLLIGCLAGPAWAGGPIRSLERVMLGGVEQTILIHGEDSANPVLLFVHGGPALSNIPFTHLNAALELDFTIVDWDQRGTGKSYRRDIPPESVRIEQFVRDTEQLAHRR